MVALSATQNSKYSIIKSWGAGQIIPLKNISFNEGKEYQDSVCVIFLHMVLLSVSAAGQFD